MSEAFNYANEVIGAELAPEYPVTIDSMVKQCGEWQGKAIRLAELVQKHHNEFGQAREKMQKTFEEDPDFKHTYVSNIAMALQDQLGTSHEDSNKVAEEIMYRIFKG